MAKSNIDPTEHSVAFALMKFKVDTLVEQVKCFVTLDRFKNVEEKIKCFVTLDQFTPVRAIAYFLVSAMAVAVTGAVFSGILSKATQ